MSVMPEQTIMQATQQIATDPGVSWELFKWVILIALGYTTGAYGLFWKLLAVLRDDRKDARDGRKDLWDALSEMKNNDLKHLQNEIDTLKGK